LEETAFLIFAFSIHPKTFSMKAFLGTGLLGSNFVQAMRKRGDEVQVWNRTAVKANELEKYGAKAFNNVSDAVKGAEMIHLTLKDDASVDGVLQEASTSLKPGVVIIDHTTTSQEGAIRRTRHWKDKGYLYQHAPVFMGPQNALESTGSMLLSGDEELIRKIEPELSKMTGKLLHFGPQPGKAAGMKLVGNAFLVCFTAGIRDMLCLAKGLNISVAELFTLFDSWNPGAMLPGRLKRMTSGDYSDPSWALTMARKDTDLFIETAQKSKIDLAVIPSIAKLMDEYINSGYGNYDWTVIAKDCI
jgi:3-hydroxyisobutyrate dehydrogenase